MSSSDPQIDRLGFPPDFLWGSATSSHQVEGGNTANTWWRWEKDPSHILDGSVSGDASGWIQNRWRDDLDHAASGGQNAHRCSLEWSRLQPAPERWDDGAIHFYRTMLQGMHERGLRPFVTLHHYTDPIWFADRGGWLADDALQRFSEYVAGAVDRFGDLCSDWCTLNEPNAYVLQGHIGGNYPPGEKSIRRAYRVAARLAEAHGAAYHVIHALQPEARVGIVILHYDLMPAHPNRAWNSRLVDALSHLVNDFFPDAAAYGRIPSLFGRTRRDLPQDTLDFFGLNYYTGVHIGWSLRHIRRLGFHYFYPPGAARSDTGLVALHPDGFTRAMRWAAAYGRPVIITENGVDDSEDALRPRFLVEHIERVWHALNDGIDVRGYFHWSIVDNYEWDKGWSHRFGLWELDPQTQVRTPRNSAIVYADICRHNALSISLLRRYSPA